MDTELPSKLLTIQHYQIDQGVEGIVDGTGEPQALAAALKLLREHVYVEEQAAKGVIFAAKGVRDIIRALFGRI